MKQLLKTKVDEMLELYLTTQKDFRWENHLSVHFAALTYSQKNKSYNKNDMKDTMSYIKENTRLFSPFRNSTFMISMLLSSEFSEPKQQFIKLLDYEKMLKEAGFKNSTYIPITCYALSLTCNENENTLQERIQKSFEIYSEMKKNHPWLTSGDDYPLSVMLANSDFSVESSIQKIEELYKSLNEIGFHRGNGLQLLSHILSFSEESVFEKTKRCEEIFEILKRNKLKIHSQYYAALGLITLLDNKNHEVVQELIDVVIYLNGLKKYKWLGKGMNVLLASVIVSRHFIEEKTTQNELIDTTLSISIEALIAAQTAATVSAIVATSAAASTTNSE
ncbi:DUF4003 family protein [Chengkuizengella axinellae]|uniref:DUF4003 family protein n=1 Tax=Chengkuizengella axinellae TaxID=3064388 RepID=A0ABT9IUM3_9BACL|nr:DUF4003 family protein [Chengkuizengella sp. 2205SS18-9]MDP5273007.1 DUF4003 family protein [Chengkuizengella sp. 2205SS18-9]